MFSAIKVLLQLVITDRNEIFRPCEDIYSHLAHELSVPMMFKGAIPFARRKIPTSMQSDVPLSSTSV